MEAFSCIASIGIEDPCHSLSRKMQLRLGVELQRQNVNGMNLVEGKGNLPGNLQEGDKINTVYVLVSGLSTITARIAQGCHLAVSTILANLVLHTKEYAADTCSIRMTHLRAAVVPEPTSYCGRGFSVPSLHDLSLSRETYQNTRVQRFEQYCRTFLIRMATTILTVPSCLEPDCRHCVVNGLPSAYCMTIHAGFKRCQLLSSRAVPPVPQWHWHPFQSRVHQEAEAGSPETEAHCTNWLP